MSLRSILFFATMLCVVHGRAYSLPYTVQRGDTLSRIAKKFVAGRAYGKNGSINKIISLNPNVKDADLILVGRTIIVADPRSDGDAGDALRPAPATARSQGATGAQPAALSNDLDKADFAHFVVTGSLYFSEIQSKDKSSAAKATFASKPNSGVSVAWLQNWSERFVTGMHAQVRKESYEPSVSIRKLKNASHWLAGFELSGTYSLSSRNTISLASGFDQELMPRVITGLADIELQTVLVPKTNLGVSHMLIKRRTLAFSLDGGAIVKMPSRGGERNSKTSVGYDAGMHFSQTLESSEIGSKIMYAQYSLTTDHVDDQRRMVGMQFYWHWTIE